ncbi:hypothetical protein C1646_757211 [Rhizophagus diaphanus]|nr:hypothetical protein C1646_757211 [Rhizophagus diaphanus] [Rhizophagus sp. MUCL 43196]
MNRKNISKTYVAKWELLQEWLADPILKLQIAITILQDDDFENFVNGLVTGIVSALNSLETWMGMWLHLPLSICRLGGHIFACSYLNAIIGLPWKYVPSLKELCYAKQLRLDLENQKELSNFGLHMAFFAETLNFCEASLRCY